MAREHAVSVRNACRAVRVPRSCYYAPVPERDEHDVIATSEECIRDAPGYGFDMTYAALRHRGYGKGRLYRVYRQRS